MKSVNCAKEKRNNENMSKNEQNVICQKSTVYNEKENVKVNCKDITM